MERRAERLRSLLTMLGWPPQRVESRCLTPSDDADLADLVTRWAGEIEALGPNPRRRESSDGR
jgi:coenzyme F420-reducing hydrogenase delta subunit